MLAYRTRPVAPVWKRPGHAADEKSHWAELLCELERRIFHGGHGGRLALMGAVGSQPVVEGGEQKSARFSSSAGLSLTLGFGAKE
jgi:hypothetical protein